MISLSTQAFRLKLTGRESSDPVRLELESMCNLELSQNCESLTFFFLFFFNLGASTFIYISALQK